MTLQHARNRRHKIKSIFNKKWEDYYSKYIKDDSYHNLSRKEQVVVFSLRTEHYRLMHHLHSILELAPQTYDPVDMPLKLPNISHKNVGI